MICSELVIKVKYRKQSSMCDREALHIPIYEAIKGTIRQMGIEDLIEIIPYFRIVNDEHSSSVCNPITLDTIYLRCVTAKCRLVLKIIVDKTIWNRQKLKNPELCNDGLRVFLGKEIEKWFKVAMTEDYLDYLEWEFE